MHFIFVPVIIYGIAVWLNFVPVKFTVPYVPDNLLKDYPQTFIGTASLALNVILCLYYATLDLMAALVTFVMVSLLSFGANYTVFLYGISKAFWVGLAAEIIGWGFQVVIGHGYFEKRKPALTESYFQTLVSPFFLALEFLFMFGYRRSLCEEIDRRSAAKIRAWKESLARKSK